VPRGNEEDNLDNQVSSVGETVKKRGSWKGAAIQRGLEPGSKGKAIVRSRYQKTTSEEIKAGKDLECVL
jgi:hypothetical protein